VPCFPRAYRTPLSPASTSLLVLAIKTYKESNSFNALSCQCDLRPGYVVVPTRWELRRHRGRAEAQ
jgi:hypothetical protein